MTTIAATSRTVLPRGPLELSFKPLGTRLGPTFGLCCIGTSITVGTATTGSNAYRKALWQKFQSAGLSPTFRGRNADGSPGGSPWLNCEGVVGSTLPDHMIGGSADTVSWIAATAAASRPDVLLHELGVNDSSSGPLTAAFASNMATYIGQLEAIQPFRHVWSLSPQRGDASLQVNLNTINAAIQSTVPTLVAGGTKILYVDSRMLQLVPGTPGAHYERAGTTDIHPNDDGANLMAEQIFAGILLASGRQLSFVGDWNG
jgi:lysophospholipase L1-like esterase